MFHVKLLKNIIADVCKLFADTFRMPVSTFLCRKLFKATLMKNTLFFIWTAKLQFFQRIAKGISEN